MIGTAQQIRRSAGGLNSPGLLEKTRSRSSQMCRAIFRRTGRMYPHERNRKIDPISREKAGNSRRSTKARTAAGYPPGCGDPGTGGRQPGRGGFYIHRAIIECKRYPQRVQWTAQIPGRSCAAGAADPPGCSWRRSRRRSSGQRLIQRSGRSDPVQLQQIPGRSCGAADLYGYFNEYLYRAAGAAADHPGQNPPEIPRAQRLIQRSGRSDPVQLAQRLIQHSCS